MSTIVSSALAIVALRNDFDKTGQSWIVVAPVAGHASPARPLKCCMAATRTRCWIVAPVAGHASPTDPQAGCVGTAESPNDGVGCVLWGDGPPAGYC